MYRSLLILVHSVTSGKTSRAMDPSHLTLIKFLQSTIRLLKQFTIWTKMKERITRVQSLSCQTLLVTRLDRWPWLISIKIGSSQKSKVTSRSQWSPFKMEHWRYLKLTIMLLRLWVQMTLSLAFHPMQRLSLKINWLTFYASQSQKIFTFLVQHLTPS